MKTWIAGMTAALGLAAAANADTVTMKFVGTGSGQAVKITALNNTFNVFAGQLKHQILSGTGEGASMVGMRNTFCTDLAQYVNGNASVYTIKPVSELPKSPQQPAMGAARAQAIIDIFAFANGAQVANGAANDFAAAFQLAVWEIVCDYNANLGLASINMNGGAFKAKSTNGQALSGAITGHLSNLFGAIGSNAQNPGIRGLASETNQDQLTLVPLPTAAWIGLGGLGIAAVIRRRHGR